MTDDEAARTAWFDDERIMRKVTFITMAVLFGLGMGVVFWALSENLPEWLAVTIGAIGGVLAGLLFATCMVWLFSKLWKRRGGLATAKALQRALSSRRLPDDADPQTWRPLLLRQVRDTERKWWYLAFFIGLTALYLTLTVTGALDLPVWLTLGGAVMFGGIAIYTPFETRNRRRVAERFLAQLHDREQRLRIE